MSGVEVEEEEKEPTTEEKISNLRTRGNQSFKAADWSQVIAHFSFTGILSICWGLNQNQAVFFYSGAIELTRNVKELFSNRSAAYVKMSEFGKALKDADACIALDKQWAKGWGRRGDSLFGLKNTADALGAYKEGLAHEPASAKFKCVHMQFPPWL